MKRRALLLWLTSALVSPATALAAGCTFEEWEEIATSGAKGIALGAIKGAIFGGIAVAATALVLGTAATAPIAIPLFAGVTLATGVVPELLKIKNGAIGMLEASVEGF